MLKENERNLETASKYYVDLSWYGLEIYYTINATSVSSFSIKNNIIDYYTILLVSIIVPIGFFICWNFWWMICWRWGYPRCYDFDGNYESIWLKCVFPGVPLFCIPLAWLLLWWIFPFFILTI